MRLRPDKIGLERAGELREGDVAVVAVTAPDPVQLREGRRGGVRIRCVAGDRDDPLPSFLRVDELLPAVLGFERLRRDDEDEALGGIDVVVDVLLPVGRRRDVLPIDPDVSALPLQVLVEDVDEVGVVARVGDEDLGHDAQPSSIGCAEAEASCLASGCSSWCCSRTTLLRYASTSSAISASTAAANLGNAAR